MFAPCRQESMHERVYMSLHNNETSSTANPFRWIFRCDTSTSMRSFHHSYFKIHVRLHKDETNAALGAEETSVVNQLGLSLMRNIDVYCNDERVYSHDEHHLSAYLENSLTYSCEAKSTWPQLSGWHPDEAGKFDTMTVAGNAAFATRREPLKDGAELVYWVRPNCFPFILGQKLWPGGLPMRFEIDRTPDKIVLLSALAAPASKARLEITKIYLMVQNVELRPAQRLLMDRGFARGGHYPFESVKVQTYNIPRGQTVWELGNHSLCLTGLPRLLYMCLVTETSFLGDLKANPFAFKHHDLKEVQIQLDGRDLWYAGGIRVDFEKNNWSELYFELLSSLGYMWNTHAGLDMSLADYALDNVIVAADFSKKFPQAVGQTRSPQDLTVRLRFAKATTENMRLICFGVYGNEAVIKATKQGYYEIALLHD